jgi:hypothetical protein
MAMAMATAMAMALIQINFHCLALKYISSQAVLTKNRYSEFTYIG